MTTHWTNFVTLLTAPAAFGAMATYCAEWHWSIDLAACFPVQFCTWLLVGSCTLALGRKWWRASVSAAFAALAAAAIAPDWLTTDNSPQVGESSPGIRVLSLNLLHNNIQGEKDLLRVVRTQAPDVIWCAEYTPTWQRFFHRELPDYGHRCERVNEGPFGVAMLAKQPMTNPEMIDLGHSWTPACRATIDLPSGTIGILGIHPPPPGLSRGRTAERNISLAAIPQALSSLPKNTIVFGDFNATPWNAAFRRLRSEARLSRGSTTSWLPTWPARLPALLRVPIDHILVRGDLAVHEAKLGPNFGSDHLPLLAIVRHGR